MKCIALLFLLSLSSAPAAKLPTYGKSPWYKTYHGYHHRDVDILLTTSGEIKFFPLLDKKRVSKSKAVTVKILVEYKAKKSAYWTKKSVKSKGYEISKPAHLQEKEVSIIGTVTGDIQYELKMKHDKKGVSISGSFLKVPTSDKGQYRLVIRSEVPDLYNLATDSKKSAVSTKTRGDSLLIEHLNKKVRPKRWRLSHVFKKGDLSKESPKSFRLKSKRYEKCDFYWALVDETKGKLEIKPRNKNFGLHKGFSIQTILVDVNGKEQSSGLRMEFR